MTSDDLPAAARRTGPTSRLLLGLLAAYWIAMFVGTHLPRVPKALAEQGDKLLHIGAYAGLALLLTLWRFSRGTVTPGQIVRDAVGIAAFAAFDELTQPLVGRFCDFWDWVADATGAVLGLAIATGIARRLFGPPEPVDMRRVEQ